MTSDDAASTDEAETGDGSESRDDTGGGFAGGDLLEGIVMVMSVLLVVGLLGYLASQAVVTPAGAQPTAAVENTEPFPADEPGAETVRVTVVLVNEGDTGLESVEVAVRCGGAERSLVFSYVPANGHRTGTAICPADSNPRASVVAWIES